MNKGKTLRNIALLAGGVAIGYYLYKKAVAKAKEALGTFRPIIDTIRVFQDGALREVVTFQWDEEERCLALQDTLLHPDGSIERERTVEFEYYDDKILVAETDSEKVGVPILSTLILDPFGMIRTVIKRKPGGKEERWDTVMDGNELQKVVYDRIIAEMTWAEGDLQEVRSLSDDTLVTLTYYKQVQNHIFPDLNLLYSGFSTTMMNTYLLGLRSLHYVRSLTQRKGSEETTTLFSYLCDHFDRPVQILMETTHRGVTGTTQSHREFEITYNS